MRNPIRLLSILTLLIHFMGCTAFVNEALPSLALNHFSRSAAHPETYPIVSTAIGNRSANISTDVSQSPVVQPATYEMESRSEQAKLRRQRDLRFAQLQQEATNRIIQQQLAHESSANSIEAQRASVNGIASPLGQGETAVDGGNVAPTKLVAGQSELNPESVSTESGQTIGRQPFLIATVMALVLGGVTWPLTRFQRRAISRVSACNDDELLADSSICIAHCPDNYDLPDASTAFGVSSVEFSSICLNLWSEKELVATSSANSVPTVSSLPLEAPRVATEAMRATQTLPLIQHKLAVLTELPDATTLPLVTELASEIVFPAVTNLPVTIPVRPIVASSRWFRQPLNARFWLKRRWLALPYHESAFEVGHSAIEKRATRDRVFPVPLKVSYRASMTSFRCAAHPSIARSRLTLSRRFQTVSQCNRSLFSAGSQLVGPSAIVGIVVLFDEEAAIPLAKRVMMVQSYQFNNQSELTAQVVQVA